MGLDHGVIMGQDKARRKAWLPVQVASIDTLHRRPNMPAADLIIVDECRFAVSDTWRSVLDRYPDASILGLGRHARTVGTGVAWARYSSASFTARRSSSSLIKAT